MTKEFKKIFGQDETRYVLEDGTSTTSGSIASVSSELGAVQRRNPDNILAQEADKNKVPATKPRNFVAKNAKMGGAGQHKDKKKAVKQGDQKHKKPLAENVDNLEIALQQARQITKMIKYDDTVTDIIVKIQALAEKFNIDATDIRYAIDDVYEAKHKLESVVYGLDEIFEDAVRNARNAADDEEDLAEGPEYNEYSDEVDMVKNNLHTIVRSCKDLADALIDGENLPEWVEEKVSMSKQNMVTVAQYLQSQHDQGHVYDEDWGMGGYETYAGTRHGRGVAEEWSQKYKNSINCSHPKGFSQKAHCAGKKKHDESIEMEMVCPECGMCQTHGNNMMEVKQRLDAKCWKGKHKEGTKIKGGIRVNNCVPNESIAEDSYMESLAKQLAEKIPKNAPVDVYIKDFEKSNAPQFRGKTKEKRRQMAIAASYGAKNPSKKK
jgi:hypothetical protein